MAPGMLLSDTVCATDWPGALPSRGAANLEKAVKLELSVCGGQDFLNFSRSRESSVWAVSCPL